MSSADRSEPPSDIGSPEPKDGLSHVSWPNYLRLAGLVAVSWVVMTSTHELGHLVGGWCSGAILQSAELRPWRLPHSIFAPDPHPLVTLWSGPVLGCLVPVIFALAMPHRWLWFVAHFCILANGAYLATAWFSGDRLLDTHRLFDAGASRMSVLLFVILSIGFGYPSFRRSCQRELQ